MKERTHILFSVAMSVTVIAAVVIGVRIVGSPETARLQRFDQQRLADLQTIFREVQSLCRDAEAKDKLKRVLPATLDELATLARMEKINGADPETGLTYVYRVVNDTTYELCATFSLDRDSDRNVFWNHPDGKHCFTINVLDPP